jgi:hypothetical protein
MPFHQTPQVAMKMIIVRWGRHQGEIDTQPRENKTAKTHTERYPKNMLLNTRKEK